MKILKFYLQYWLTKLLYLIFILFIFYGSYCYTAQRFSIGNHMFTNPFYHVHDKMPFWINYIEYIILVFIISTILMILLTKYYSFNKIKKEKMQERYIKFYYSSVIRELFKENNEHNFKETVNISRLKKFIRNDINKELVISTLTQVHYQTIGKIRQRTELIINMLHFEKVIQSYLYSPFYKHKKFALDTISEFKIIGYEKYLLKLAKQSKNKLLHTDALITLARLNVYDNLILLADMNVDISIWDINMIIRNIEKDRELSIPYNELINARNEGMQLLGIMLTRIHCKREFKNKIQKKTEHRNPTIKEEAILTFTSFAENKDDFDFIINIYNTSPENAKINIVKRMDANPNKEQAADFFEWIAKNEPIPNKLIAIMNLLSLDISKVTKLKLSEDTSIKMACEQVLDINN